MPTIQPNPKILTCKADIKAYLGNISDYIFARYVKEGMPALYDGRWSASTENLDNWWRARTAVCMKQVIGEIPEDAE